MNPAKCHKMLLPVRTCNTCILNRISTMDHHIISYINSNMARSRRIISSLEKDQISRLCIRWRYIGTIRPKPICRCSSYIPAISAVIDYPTYETGTIKTGRWRCTAPHIRITQIFFCLPNHLGKLRIRKCFCRNIISKARPACRNTVNVKQIITISIVFVVSVILLLLFIRHTVS